MVDKSRTQFDKLAADFNRLPSKLRKELQPAFRRAGTAIVADAKSRASWSSRIPGAIRIDSSFTSRNPGVRIVVDASKAPHARAIEGNGRTMFRHRVYGRNVWVPQQTRPFLFPAVRAGQERVLSESNVAVLAAARSAGFR